MFAHGIRRDRERLHAEQPRRPGPTCRRRRRSRAGSPPAREAARTTDAAAAAIASSTVRPRGRAGVVRGERDARARHAAPRRCRSSSAERRDRAGAGAPSQPAARAASTWRRVCARATARDREDRAAAGVGTGGQLGAGVRRARAPALSPPEPIAKTGSARAASAHGTTDERRGACRSSASSTTARHPTRRSSGAQRLGEP